MTDTPTESTDLTTRGEAMLAEHFDRLGEPTAAPEVVVLIPAIARRRENLERVLEQLFAPTNTRFPDVVLLCLDGPGWDAEEHFAVDTGRSRTICIDHHEGRTLGAGARWRHPALFALEPETIVWCLDDDVEVEPDGLARAVDAFLEAGTSAVSWHGYRHPIANYEFVSIDDDAPETVRLYYFALAGLVTTADVIQEFNRWGPAAVMIGAPGGYDQAALAGYMHLHGLVARPAGRSPLRHLALDAGSYPGNRVRWLAQRDYIADVTGWYTRTPPFVGMSAMLSHDERAAYVEHYLEADTWACLPARGGGDFCVIVPTLCRPREAADVARAATADLREIAPAERPVVHLHIIDNGEDRNNRGVAAAWNIGLREALAHGATYIAILNDDVTFERGALARMMQVLVDRPEVGLVMTEEHGYAAFGLNVRAAIDLVGFFDERFHPAYAEDTDFDYRARVAGLERVLISGNGGFVHQGAASSTPAEFAERRERNLARYIAKWGGEPGHEVEGPPCPPLDEHRVDVTISANARRLARKTARQVAARARARAAESGGEG